MFYPVDENYNQVILGAVLAKAVHCYYLSRATQLSEQAHHEFKRLTDGRTRASNDVGDLLSFTLDAVMANSCGDYTDFTPYRVKESFPSATALLVSPVYGPVLRDLLNRIEATGKAWALEFLDRYGDYYRQAVAAEPHAPGWAFVSATLAAGLPLEAWLAYAATALTEELELSEVE